MYSPWASQPRCWRRRVDLFDKRVNRTGPARSTSARTGSTSPTRRATGPATAGSTAAPARSTSTTSMALSSTGRRSRSSQPGSGSHQHDAHGARDVFHYLPRCPFRRETGWLVGRIIERRRVFHLHRPVQVLGQRPGTEHELLLARAGGHHAYDNTAHREQRTARASRLHRHADEHERSLASLAAQ